jgi:hypothetical protein
MGGPLTAVCCASRISRLGSMLLSVALQIACAFAGRVAKPRA